MHFIGYTALSVVALKFMRFLLLGSCGVYHMVPIMTFIPGQTILHGNTAFLCGSKDDDLSTMGTSEGKICYSLCPLFALFIFATNDIFLSFSHSLFFKELVDCYLLSSFSFVSSLQVAQRTATHCQQPTSTVHCVHVICKETQATESSREATIYL